MPDKKKQAYLKNLEKHLQTMKKASPSKGNKPSSKSGKMLDKGNRPARTPATRKPGTKPAPMPSGPKPKRNGRTPAPMPKRTLNPLDQAILEGRKLPSRNKRPGRYLDK